MALIEYTLEGKENKVETAIHMFTMDSVIKAWDRRADDGK